MRYPSLALLAALLFGVLALAPVSTTTDDGDPFPVGACAHVPAVHGKPLCVLVDPTE